jgi:tRNA(His) 5'-end guanylyltransferase
MEQTTKDLVNEFGAVTGYTQSDEISLIFPPTFKETFKTISLDDNNLNGKQICVFDPDGNYIGKTDNITPLKNYDKGYSFKLEDTLNYQIYSGRVQKITSLISGFTTMSFNKNFNDLFKTLECSNDISIDFTDYLSIVESKLGNAWFDARAYGVNSKEEAFNSIMWRVRDCFKNAQMMFAQTYCNHNELLNKNSKEQSEYCLEKTGFDFSLIDDKYKYGIIIKKEQYYKVVDGKNIERTQLTSFSKKLTSFSTDNVDFILFRKV